MSFTSKIIGKSPIYLITCQDSEGQYCFYFVLSTPEKMRMLDAVQTGTFNVSDYGKIIESGYGKTPSPEVRKKLHDEYGF